MTRPRITVTPAVIESLAGAAGLPLSPERQQELVTHLEAILAEVARLDEVDVAGYEPPISIPSAPRLHDERAAR